MLRSFVCIARTIGVFGGLWLALFCAPAFAEPVKLRIGYNDNSAFPYFLGQGSEIPEPPGLSLDILRLVGETLGVEIQFIRKPGPRVLAELGHNKLDAGFIFSYKPAREAYGRYPMANGQVDGRRRMAVLSYMLYVPHGSRIDWNGEEITGDLNRPIGANIGYSIVADLRKRGVPVEESKSTQQNFLKLLAGRLAGVADQEIVADAHLRLEGIEGVAKRPVPLATKDYFLIFSHQFYDHHPQLAEKIWDTIAELRDETQDQLLPQYLNLTQ